MAFLTAVIKDFIVISNVRIYPVSGLFFQDSLAYNCANPKLVR